jgi:C-terminal processing protease CtpA/Prc
VVVSSSELARAGDEITAIDGVAIDELLARELPRTPAATASAAIDRAVARLLERAEKGAALELDVLREGEGEGERALAFEARATTRVERAVRADARPAKAITELGDGVVYVDATRVARLDAAARRLRKASAVVVDLRGELADADGSLLAHFVSGPTVVASEALPAGPDADGELTLQPAGDRRVEPRGRRLGCRVVCLVDSRTRGAAELELCGFDQLGATVIGSASAGELGDHAHAWLPGGWRLRFTTSVMRRADGSRLWGQGVRPSRPVAPTLAGVRAGEDELLVAALAELG